MRMILIILIIVTGLAYLAQRFSLNHPKGDRRVHWNPYLIALFIFLVLFAGLRTSYNDTSNYIQGFINSTTLRPFLADRSNLELLNNPLFYGFQAFIRSFTNNYSVFFMICAIIVNGLNLNFIRKHVDVRDFAFCMFLYTALGTLMLTLAAQKQALAMSVTTLAISALIDKRYVRYYLFVFIAGLIHSYAWLFLFFPLLDTKPWSLRTLFLLAVTLFVMYTFQGTITTLIEVADQIGKNVPMEEVFDGNRMNIFRVAVYSVVPILALIFRKQILYNLDRTNSLFIQMTIISLMFMMMGTMNGANMFGRAANYFEIGLICVLPWVVRQIFTSQSVTIILTIATFCFCSFYLYDNQGFNYNYNSKNLSQFVREVVL